MPRWFLYTRSIRVFVFSTIGIVGVVMIMSGWSNPLVEIISLIFVVMVTIIGVISISQTKKVKNNLEIFIKEGGQLKSRCKNIKIDPPSEDYILWAEKVAQYLQSTLGISEHDFYSDKGLQISPITSSSWQHIETEKKISYRIAHIRQYLSELRRK